MNKILAVLFVLFAVSTAADAQIMSNPAQWYINNQIYSTRVFNSAVANSMLQRRRGARTNGARSAAPKAAVDHTVFKESPTSGLSRTLAAKTGGQTPREAEQLFQGFINFYKQTAAKDGFPANDLAYAFEFFVVNNYQIYHDLVEMPLEIDPRARRARDGFERITIMNEKKLLQVTIPQERAVYLQFKEILGANPEIQKMTDAQKQEAAELMAVMLGVNFEAYVKGLRENNEQLAGEARRMAKEGLEKLLGAPIDRIKITNNGLEL